MCALEGRSARRGALRLALAGLAALIRSDPHTYFHGSPGEAHECQSTAALLLQATGGKMTHVPYRGVASVVVGPIREHRTPWKSVIEMAAKPSRSASK